MSKSEFILLIPGIIYGVALVDLLKIFRHKSTYWEVVSWGIIMIINLIVSWFTLYDKLEIISNSILLFTVYIISPLLFAQAIFVLTPEEENKDTKAYFLKSNRQFFILLLGFIIMNNILSFFIAENCKIYCDFTIYRYNHLAKALAKNYCPAVILCHGYYNLLSKPSLRLPIAVRGN